MRWHRYFEYTLGTKHINNRPIILFLIYTLLSLPTIFDFVQFCNSLLKDISFKNVVAFPIMAKFSKCWNKTDQKAFHFYKLTKIKLLPYSLKILVILSAISLNHCQMTSHKNLEIFGRIRKAMSFLYGITFITLMTYL